MLALATLAGCAASVACASRTAARRVRASRRGVPFASVGRCTGAGCCPARRRRRCSASRSGASRRVLSGDGALPPRARAQARRLRRPLAASRGRVRRRRAPSRATPSRSGTASSRWSRTSPASTRARRPARGVLLAPLAVPRRLRGRRRASSARAAAGVVRRSRRRSRSVGLAPGTAAPTDARAAGNRVRGSCSCRRRSRCSSLWLARGRSARPARALAAPCFGRWRSCTRPTRSSRCCRSRATRSCAVLVRAASCARPRLALGALRRADGRRVLWLLPLVPRHAPRTTRRAEQARALERRTRDQLDVVSPASYRLAPRRVRPGGRGRRRGAALVPLAGCAVPRRRWAAFVLGGSLARAGADARAGAVHALLRPRLAVAVAPRGGLPAVRVRVRRRAGAARSLAGWLVLRSRSGRDRARSCWPGDFGYRPRGRRPRRRDVVARARRRGRVRARPRSSAAPRIHERTCSRAAAARALRPPGRASHGFAHWSPRGRATVRRTLPPGLVRRCGRACRGSAIVFSDARDELPDRRFCGRSTSPPRRPRTLPTRRANRPVRAARAVQRFFATGDSRSRAASAPAGSCSTGDRLKTFACRRLYAARGTSSTVCRREGPDRLALLPARGRRRRPAAAQVRDAPARARDRDARARAGRSEVDPPRRGSSACRRRRGCTASASSGRRAAAGRGAARHRGARARSRAGAVARPAAALPGRERDAGT